MDFDLSPDERAFQDSVSRFAQDKLAAGALARAHEPGYPWETAQLLASQGLLGIVMPEYSADLGGEVWDTEAAGNGASGPRSSRRAQGLFQPGPQRADPERRLAVRRGEELVAMAAAHRPAERADQQASGKVRLQ